MSILVIGLGQMGTNYLNKLLAAGIAAEEIVGYDIDAAKSAAARAKFPNVLIEDRAIDGNSIQAAIVATNTPSHHQVMIDLMRGGVRYILCEKPLGINPKAVAEVDEEVNDTGTEIHTAFLMTFSLVLKQVIALMEDKNLILTEGSVVWGKNRFGDSRPTPGDLEDETVHGVGILHSLLKVNQDVYRIDLSARLTYPKYASPEAQAKAHALDPSFPMEVNASTMAMERILTSKGEVTCHLHSSFIMAQQTRRVTAVLSRADDPLRPVYSVEMNFDVKAGGRTVDQLMLTQLDGNRVEAFELAADKLQDQTQAWLDTVRGLETDPRLTSFEEAKQAVDFSDAVLRSHQKGGDWVNVYDVRNTEV